MKGYQAREHPMTIRTKVELAIKTDEFYAQLPYDYSASMADKLVAEYRKESVHALRQYSHDDGFGNERHVICINKVDLARFIGQEKMNEAYENGELIV
jgi:hypothetical protein